VSKPRKTYRPAPARPISPSAPAPQSAGIAKPPSALGEPPSASPTFDAFAIAAPGLAPFIERELGVLGIPVRERSAAGVGFDATAPQLLAVNLWSRMASRVLVRLAHFEARDFATLEKQAARVAWLRVLAPGAPVRLRVTCRKSRLYHSDAVAERVARGIETAVRGAHASGRARDDDEDEGEAPAQLIVVRFDHDRCTISADSSGALLHRRGWRQAIAKAPLRETLAASMLAACEWNGDVPLVDPFCGSGTIGIEGALRARNIAPGIGRVFAMEQWPHADVTLSRQLRDDARAQERPWEGVPIVLRDRDAGACAAAVANAERAGVRDACTIEHGSLSETDLAAIGERGLVLTNPPYGLRISEGADLRSLYARLGDVVKAGGPGWQLGILVPDQRLLSPTTLSFDPVLRTTNGGLPVTVERSCTTKKTATPVRRENRHQARK